jgi:hypothetical protein
MKVWPRHKNLVLRPEMIVSTRESLRRAKQSHWCNWSYWVWPRIKLWFWRPNILAGSRYVPSVRRDIRLSWEPAPVPDTDTQHYPIDGDRGLYPSPDLQYVPQAYKEWAWAEQEADPLRKTLLYKIAEKRCRDDINNAKLSQ